MKRWLLAVFCFCFFQHYYTFKWLLENMMASFLKILFLYSCSAGSSLLWKLLSSVASRGYLVAMRGLSLWQPRLLQGTVSRACRLRSCGSGATRSAVADHMTSCNGIFPDEGPNPCPCTGKWILYHLASGSPWLTSEK